MPGTSPAVRCRAHTTSIDTVDCTHWYSSPAALPHNFMGPVKAVHITGKGRGVIATEALARSQLVMLVPPLALLTANDVMRPHAEQLVDHILATPHILNDNWMNLLYDGTTKSTRTLPDIHELDRQSSGAEDNSEHGVINALVADRLQSSQITVSKQRQGFSKSKAAGSDKRQSASISKHVAVEAKRHAKRVAKVVSYNAYGDDHDDLAACAVMGQPPSGHVGVWPQFALLNHSCAPNTINYVLGDKMVVRAVQNIPQGDCAGNPVAHYTSVAYAHCSLVDHL
eukprot:jgi/Chrzof1/9239/Cz03g40310.t1